MSVAVLPSSTSVCARGEVQVVALSARCAWLGRRAHCSTHIMCSRALNRNALSQPCLRAPASALEAKLRQWRSVQGMLGWGGVRTAQRTLCAVCFESLCCAPVFAQKPCLSSRKRSGDSVKCSWLERSAQKSPHWPKMLLT